jgi:spore maturation protein CgeB
MQILIFEYEHMGIEDICEALKNIGHTFSCVTSELIYENNNEFSVLFEEEISKAAYDAVFTFNYFPSVSACCNNHHMPYISFAYDSPLVSLYSYTIINPCNHVFLFDKSVYLDFNKENINTVHYIPLAVNVSRLDAMKPQNLPSDMRGRYTSDISFIGTMYNEVHNLFDRMKSLSDYTAGYLDGIMKAQMKVYGYYFIEELLTKDILEDMQKNLPIFPHNDGVETSEWLFAYYVIARKIANLERTELLGKISEKFDTKLFTPYPTPELPAIHNMGRVDYQREMPYVFKCSDINLNITLRSIRTGIPLRCLDILGSGGFLLSNYQADFYEHFVPGEDLVLFESHEDCIQKCDYYLKHDKERQQIAANGYGKVKECHTYEIRLNEIFERVF